MVLIVELIFILSIFLLGWCLRQGKVKLMLLAIAMMAIDIVAIIKLGLFS